MGHRRRTQCGLAILPGHDSRSIVMKVANRKWSGVDQPVCELINQVRGIDQIGVSRRFQDGARRGLMVLFKWMINCLLAMTVLALAMPLANAGNPHGRGQRQQHQSDQRETTQSYGHNDRDGEGKRSQRLSPEERRQLRRDIKEAGRKIYSPRR